MKLSEAIAQYARNPRQKATLNADIQLDNGTVFEKGTISSLLVKKGNGKYHFETNDSACTVDQSELTFIR